MSASTRALADLARAGYRVLHEPSMQVEFEIHHLCDRPGRLVEIVSGDPGGVGFAETLSSCANGVGLVIGTRIGDTPGRPALSEHQHGAWVHLEHDQHDRAGFRGSERPNLTFQHESAQTFEGVISIEDEPKRMLLRHGLMVADTAAHIAETALHAGEAALLSMQCPAQLPPTNSFWEGGGIDGRVVEPARSSSTAIRFSMALQRPSADTRLQVADRLARHCEERGLGLWLADTRPGYRTGNWFLVLPHDRSTAREAAYQRAADQRRAGYAADGYGCLPLTLVGPARQGSVHAILSYLGRFPAIAVLACSMTVLDELAFLHLQLGVNAASRSRLAALNATVRELRASHHGPADLLSQIFERLSGEMGTERSMRELTGRLLDRAGDYQAVLGPALPVVAENTVRRVPIWIGWRMRKSDAGLRSPLLALDRAVERLGLRTDADRGRAGGPNIEYLVCRQLGAAMLSGKGKLAVARDVVDLRAKDNRHGSAQFAHDLEEAWKAQLRSDGSEHRFSEVSVSSREFLLGDGQPLA